MMSLLADQATHSCGSWQPKGVPPPEQHSSPFLQHFPRQHCTLGGQQSAAPVFDGPSWEIQVTLPVGHTIEIHLPLWHV